MGFRSKALGGSLLLVSLVALSGCESSGGTHVAGIGASPPPASGGGSGSGGSGSGGNGGGDLGALPIGSITGSGGVGGTGLLANLGTAGQTSPLAPVLVTAGNAALGLDQPLTGVTQTVNGLVPTLAPVTNSITQTVDNLGTALNGAATGKVALVDGVTQSVSPVVTVGLGGANLRGGKGSSLINLGVGQGASSNGSLVNLNLASTTPVPTVGSLLGGSSVGGLVNNVTGALPVTGAVQTVVNSVVPTLTDTVSAVLPSATSGGLTGSLPVVGTVLGGLSGTSATASGSVTGSLPVVSTVLGGLSGTSATASGSVTGSLPVVSAVLGGTASASAAAATAERAAALSSERFCRSVMSFPLRSTGWEKMIMRPVKSRDRTVCRGTRAC